jgi:hypothetical protein
LNQDLYVYTLQEFFIFLTNISQEFLFLTKRGDYQGKIPRKAYDSEARFFRTISHKFFLTNHLWPSQIRYPGIFSSQHTCASHFCSKADCCDFVSKIIFFGLKFYGFFFILWQCDFLELFWQYEIWRYDEDKNLLWRRNKKKRGVIWKYNWDLPHHRCQMAKCFQHHHFLNKTII